MLNLQTPHGDLDLTMAPAAFPRGYDDMVARSTYKPWGKCGCASRHWRT